MTPDDATRETDRLADHQGAAGSRPVSPDHVRPAPARRAMTVPWGILGLGIGAILAYVYARAAGYG